MKNRIRETFVSSAIVANEGIIDVFTAAGLPKPDISILSDQFLAEVRGLKYKNVAAELRGWLSLGKINWTAKATLNSRGIASVTQIQTPPSGITIDSTTKFFLLNVNLTEQELDLHPQLLLPIDGTYGSVVTAATLYVSEQTTAGAP